MQVQIAITMLSHLSTGIDSDRVATGIVQRDCPALMIMVLLSTSLSMTDQASCSIITALKLYMAPFREFRV